MKKVLAIVAIALILVSCGSSYQACAGVDGGRPCRGCSRQQIMNKRYFVSDYIVGVFFKSKNDLKEYYKQATKKINGERKLKDIKCGKIESLFEDELRRYIFNNNTHNNHLWREV